MSWIKKRLVLLFAASILVLFMAPSLVLAGLPNGELEHIWEDPLDPNVAPPLGGSAPATSGASV